MSKRYLLIGRFRKLFNIFIVLLLTVGLIIPGTPRTVNAGQNPSLQEIAKIFERVAEEKEVPAEILKAIAYTESGWRQWDSRGNVVANYAGKRPYLGIMQVGTYDPADTETVNQLKNNITFNIAYGADVLLSKWEMTPRIGDGDRSKLENWYFAIWAYNTWSIRNNPNNASAAGRVAYQDKILKLVGTEFYKGVVNPVQITPVSKALIPAGTLPTKSVSWKTPQPIHYASFSTITSFLSRSEETAFLGSVNRIAGTDRIDTAVKISAKGWPYGCGTVVIAKSGNFPDALAGVALAKENNAPILLTPQDYLDQRVEEALLQLKPLKVIILGGEEAISQQVEKELKELLTWTEDFERIAGEDRFQTAALIAASLPTDKGLAITTGSNFPDALSLAAAAAAKGYPLLLVSKDSIPQATAEVLQTMSPGKIYIAGGEETVSEESLNKVKEITGITDEQITRFAGKDRYETSTLIVQGLFPETSKIFLATGQNFPDALAGAALAANTDTPMLLVAPDGPPAGTATEKYLKSLTNVEIEVFGGKSAVSDKSIIWIKYLLGLEKN